MTDIVEICWDPVSGVPYVELRASLPVHLNIQDTANVAQKANAREESKYVSTTRCNTSTIV